MCEQPKSCIMKRKFPIFLAFLMLFILAVGALPAAADDTYADVKLYAEKSVVAIGAQVKVAVYFENITLPGGIVSCDLPLTYDNDILKLTAHEEIYPKNWGSYGAFFGEDIPSNGVAPYYLRVVCDANDLVKNPEYGVKEDKKLGFILTFTTISKGEAEVAIEEGSGNNEKLYVVDGSLKNYEAKGSSIKIKVEDDSQQNSSDDTTSDTTDISDLTSSESSDDTDSSLDSSEISDVISGVSSDDSTMDSNEITEDTSSAEPTSSEVSELSEASSETALSSTESQDSASLEISEESAAEGEGKSFSPLPIIIVAILAVVAAVGTVLGIVFSKKQSKKTEAELDNESNDE